MSTHVNPALGNNIVKQRLFSLFGIIPLGTYLVVHLYNNTKALQGPEAYNRYLTESKASPYYFALMLVGFYFPLLWHAVTGIQRSYGVRFNYLNYSYFRNLKFILQRLSALGLLLFIPAHIYKTRIEPFLSHQPIDFNHMMEGFREAMPIPGTTIALPYVTVIVYLLGTLGACYHFANGLWTASISWGIISNAKTQRCWEIVTMLIFVVMYAMALASIYGIYYPKVL